MRAGLVIFAITAFFLADAWHDGKYTKLLKSGKKYYKMGLIAFAGLSAYAFVRKHPESSRDMALQAATLVKALPIDKEAGDLLTPLLSGGAAPGPGDEWLGLAAARRLRSRRLAAPRDAPLQARAR